MICPASSTYARTAVPPTVTQYHPSPSEINEVKEVG